GSVMRGEGNATARAGAREIGRAKEPPIEELIFDDVVVHPYGDAAVVTGRTFGRVGGASPLTVRLRFTDFFVRRSDQWQVVASQATQLAPPPSPEALIARAKSFERDTPYIPPPGDPLEHDASGFAKIMCSAVFITGLDPDFAAENVGYFTAPYAARKKLGKPLVDRANRQVQVTVPGGRTLTA